jgi:outer membrane protein
VNAWTIRGLIGMTALAVATGAVPVAHAQAPLTLQAAVDVALAQHPSVAVAQQALVAAQARLAEAQSAINLQVSVSDQSSNGNSANFPAGGATGTTNSLPVAATLQLVNQQVQYQVQQAQAAVASADASLVQARQDVALTAGQAYFSVLRAQAVAAAREVAVAQTEAQVRQAEAQVRAGAAARADVLQAQAARAAAQVDLIAARNQVETALAGLQAAMGRPLTDGLGVALPPAPLILPLSRDQAIAAASGRPEVVRAHSGVIVAQAALALAEVRAQPLLSVGSSASVDVSRFPSDPRYLIWSVSATVTYPLVDGGLAQATIAEARANLVGAQAQEVFAIQSAQVDAFNAWVSLQDATSRVDATHASETAAAEALRAAEGRYRAGVGTIVEVLTARTTFQTASLSRIQAEFDVQTAVLQLRRAVGRPVIGGSR